MFIKGIDQEQGEVIAVRDRSATVLVKANRNCDRCRICKRVSASEMVVEALTSHTVQVGDRVVLGVRPGIIVKSATILYILPLFGLIAGYYAARLIGNVTNLGFEGELVPALSSIAALFACFLPIWLWDRRRRKQERFQVYVKERA